MDDEQSRGSSGGEDYDFDDMVDDGEDFEETIDEEEVAGADNDYADELKDLEDEGEMDIEELRRKYGYPSDDVATSSNNCQASSENGSSSVAASGEAVKSYFEDAGNSNDGDEENEDVDYAPPDPWKKEIRVDQEKFQATIPALQASQQTDDEHATAVWLAVGEESLTEDTIKAYLSEVHLLRVSIGQQFPEKVNESRDDEDALAALMKNNYDVEKAKASFPFPHVNAAVISVRPDALSFDEDEGALFEEGLEKCGKNFPMIQKSKLPYRYIGELVDYYYKWKMTPRYREWRKLHPQYVKPSQLANTDLPSIEVNGVDEEELPTPQAL